MWSYASGTREGGVRLERTLELANQMGFESLVGSIWHSLAWGALRLRAYADFDRYIDLGLAYVGEHDLEIYQRYLRPTRRAQHRTWPLGRGRGRRDARPA